MVRWLVATPDRDCRCAACSASLLYQKMQPCHVECVKIAAMAVAGTEASWQSDEVDTHGVASAHRSSDVQALAQHIYEI